MTKLGDVVFCVDCDRLREAQRVEDGAPDQDLDQAQAQSEEHPRRMATKRDANGDPLCAQCLDDRLKNRRAEFMHGDERRNVIHWPRRSDDPSGDAAPRPLLPGLSAVMASASASDEHPAAKPARNSKAAFVRSLPADTPAKEVVAKARQQGIDITPAYIYVIRSMDHGKAPSAAPAHKAKPNGAPPRASRIQERSAPPQLREQSRADLGIERRFMWLAVELGFVRTEQLLDELKAKVRLAVVS